MWRSYVGRQCVCVCVCMCGVCVWDAYLIESVSRLRASGCAVALERALHPQVDRVCVCVIVSECMCSPH